MNHRTCATDGQMIESLEQRQFLSATTYDFGRLTGYALTGHAWTYDSTYSLKSNVLPDKSGSGEGTVSVARQGRSANYKVQSSGSGAGATMIFHQDGQGTSVAEIDGGFGNAKLQLKLSGTQLAPKKLSLNRTYSDAGTFSGTFGGAASGLNVSGKISGSSTASCHLVRQETASVPAGQFACVKGTYTVNLSGTLVARVSGKTYNIAFSASYPTTFWAMQDLGMVKIKGTVSTTLRAEGDNATVTASTSSSLVDFSPGVAEFWAYVDQPGAGGDRVASLDVPSGNPDFGHAWWQFKVPAAWAKLLPADLKPYVNTPTGFNATNPITASQWTSPGVLSIPDTANLSGLNVQNHWSIGWAGLLAGLRYAQQLDQNPDTYDLEVFNSTDAVIAAGAAANVDVPQTPGDYFGQFEASDTGDFGEDLMDIGGQRVS